MQGLWSRTCTFSGKEFIMNIFTCEKATPAHIEYLCSRNIEAHPDDKRWTAWMEEARENYKTGRTAVFVVCCNGIPAGEVTLIFSPECSAVNGRIELADQQKTANINALRIQKMYEGQGHISKLMKMTEAYAKEQGYVYLTIGVEAKETRNLGIYLHWGYDEFVISEEEDGELILYYRKKLK